MPRDHILAIDVGTSSIKILTLDRQKRIGTIYTIPHDPVETSGELNVANWLKTIRQTLTQANDPEPWAAIAVTGQMHGLVPLLRAGDGSLAPGIGMSWADTRGADLVPEMNRQIGESLPTRIGGRLAPGFQAVHLEWLKRNHPSGWNSITRVMLPKDALIHALTGRHVTDPSDAAGTGLFDPANGIWAWDVADSLGFPRDWLPELVSSGTIVGEVMARAGSQSGIAPGTPVIIAGGDASVGAIGAGIGLPGQTMIMLSTGAQIIQPIPTYEPDPDGRWYTWPSARPASSHLAPWIRAGTLLNSGVIINWLQDILGERDLYDPNSEVKPTGLVTLPYLTGERTPLHDPLARGTILGLRAQTTRSQIAGSMLEGVAFSLRLAMDAMQTSDPPPELLTVGGGGVNIPALQQIITDCIGIPTRRLDMAESTAFGAALIAADALGWYSVDQHVHVDPHDPPTTIMSPDPERHRQYSELFAMYSDAVHLVAPISHRIAAWQGSRS